jgi:hypothetical protein
MTQSRLTDEEWTATTSESQPAPAQTAQDAPDQTERADDPQTEHALRKRAAVHAATVAERGSRTARRTG